MVDLLPSGGTVALVGGTADSVNSKHRLSGFERGIRATRVRVVARVDADYDRAKAAVDAERSLHLHPRLSGFFAVNDEMALGVADSVRSAGKIGSVKIIGVDGPGGFAEYAAVPANRAVRVPPARCASCRRGVNRGRRGSRAARPLNAPGGTAVEVGSDRRAVGERLRQARSA